MLQDILDEVIEGSPRYNIQEAENGNKIIELANPVITIGTPINRALFRNLQGDLYTEDRYSSPTYNGNNLTLDLPLTSYEVGKVIKIKSPITSSSAAIDINGLGARNIQGDIIANKYYNLVFDGNRFVIQRTKTNISKSPIIITTSGNYTIDRETTYKVILVGGGGGSAVVLNTYSDMNGDVRGGGSGGVIIDTFIPTSSTVSVTIGSAGANQSGESSSSLRVNGTNGGNTIVGNLIAYGGSGGSAFWSRHEDTRGTNGKGGSFAGGLGANGNDGTVSSDSDNSYGTGGVGFTIEGVEYGYGGSVVSEILDADIISTRSPNKGVAIFYPML